MKIRYFFLVLILFITYQTLGFSPQHTDQYTSRIFTPYMTFNLTTRGISYENKTSADSKSNTNTTKKIAQTIQREFIWTAFKTESFETQMTIRFVCDKKNQMNIYLTDHGQPDFVKEWQAIVRMVTGNFPPSRKGYKKIIYTGKFMNDGKTLPIRQRDIKYFLEELNILRTQVFKNKEMGIKEYNEKINYCNKLPKKRQQLCYNSASGYQVKEPHIIIWIVAEEIRHPAGKYGVFDPKPLENLQNLPCY